MEEQRRPKQRRRPAMGNDDGVDDGFSSFLPEPLSTTYSTSCPAGMSGRRLLCASHGPGHSPLFQSSMSTLVRMTEIADKTMTRIQQQWLMISEFKFYFPYEGSNDWVHLLEKWIGVALDNNVEDRC
ncbi:hypothetical protein CDL15_Pgr011080 [Punica granatum]|uniref:Uncharacterized protein n=1 Tax=Punica granatum TaxID=22663 RepID=A0A218XNK9_PUNGR|nr:hypothetical protein CDL15_Pgr011080 [Punica granatum]PKI44303.1 hypothetical protein CRG98_035377 [Punica granatum]